MKITEMKYKNDKVQVFVDHSYAFSSSQDFILENRLFVNKQIDKDALDNLTQTAILENLRLKLVSYVLSSFNSKSEYFSKLRTYSKKKYRVDLKKEDFENFWSYLLKNNLYSEEKIIESLSNKYFRENKGIIYTKSKLLAKGFDVKEHKSILDKVYSINQSEDIKKLISKKLAGKDKRDLKAKASVFRFLISRGFLYEDILKAWKETTNLLEIEGD